MLNSGKSCVQGYRPQKLEYAKIELQRYVSIKLIQNLIFPGQIYEHYKTFFFFLVSFVIYFRLNTWLNKNLNIRFTSSVFSKRKR